MSAPTKYDYFKKIIPDPIIFTEIEKYAIQHNKDGLFNDIFFYKENIKGSIETQLYRGFYKIYTDDYEILNIENTEYENYYFTESLRTLPKDLHNIYYIAVISKTPIKLSSGNSITVVGVGF